jgi:hypothetical protein
MRILVLLLCLFFVPEAVSAYYPDTTEIAAKLKRQYRSLDSFQAVINFEEDSSLELRIWQQGQRWRQEWIKKSAQKKGVIAAAIGSRDNVIVKYPTRNSFPEPIFHFWQRQEPLKWWQKMGVKTKIKSYQFLNHRPCIVLGAKYNESEQPQVWIDNEEMVPLSIRTGRNTEWQWSKYQNLGNFLLPQKGKVISGQGNTFSFKIDWRAINRDMSPVLFRRRAFEEKFGNAPAPSSSFNSQLLQQLKMIIPLAEPVN